MPYVHPAAMVKFFKVKEKARGLARQQKFEQALAEYRVAIAQAEADGDGAALRNLYNAAGDASLLKNDAAAAVEFFERAADLYLQEGLYDNAIALCHKILRNVPTKAEAYARLGRIYGEKGLRNEAIQNWLEFADRRQKASDLAGVKTALREVVTLSPEVESVREQLVEILVARGEGSEALGELAALRRLAEKSGQAEKASEIGERMVTLRREYGIAESPRTTEDAARDEAGAAPASTDGGLGLESFGKATWRATEGDGAPAGSPVPGLDSAFGLSRPAPELAPPELGGPKRAAPADARPSGETLRGERPRGIEPPGRAAETPSLEPPASAASQRPEAKPRPGAPPELPPIGSLPGFTAPDAPPAEAASAQPATAGAAAPAPEDGAPADVAAKQRPAVVSDLPSIAFVPVEQRIASAEARLAENPADAEERIYLGEIYQEAGSIDLALSAMQQGAAELLAAGQTDKAWRAYRRVAALAPDEIEVVQKLVEVAQAGGSREQLIQSYELMGDRLMESGQYARAADIHRRILEIDPAHRHSHDQLLLLDGLESQPGPAAGVAPGGEGRDYVDLARLIGEAEPARVTDPRMTVKARPTGDDEADLEAIIEAFRQGVELNIDEGDHESHYDLGVAFRQMGLLDEAIREFQLAARGPEHRERAFELMGLCFMEKGMPSVAVNCFRRGIESERNPHQALGLHYHLARSLEELGQAEAAREEYERVVALDVRFLDAADRLRRLS